MKLADYANTKMGIKEGTNAFYKLIDDYNNECRKKNTYKMSYNDSWCACFVSICLTHCGYSTKYNSVDCDALFRNLAKYEIARKDAKRNDIVFYSWKHTNSDLQHVGIISNRMGNYINVIEGNKNNSVAIRQINVYDADIRHIVRMPDITTGTGANTSYNPVVIAKDVIKGKYGNGADRKKNLESHGYDYKLVQKEVNKLLKK